LTSVSFANSFCSEWWLFSLHAPFDLENIPFFPTSSTIGHSRGPPFLPSCAHWRLERSVRRLSLDFVILHESPPALPLISVFFSALGMSITSFFLPFSHHDLKIFWPPAAHPTVFLNYESLAVGNLFSVSAPLYTSFRVRIKGPLLFLGRNCLPFSSKRLLTTLAGSPLLCVVLFLPRLCRIRIRPHLLLDREERLHPFPFSSSSMSCLYCFGIILMRPLLSIYCLQVFPAACDCLSPFYRASEGR